MTAEPHLQLPKVGDCIAGKYDVERVLGEGGMGLVYLAVHRELRQPVALKVLQPEVAEHVSSSERFRREARAAAAMRGEHVCRVLDVDTHEGIPFIVMEFLEGRDLAAELEARGPLPVPEAVDCVLQACEALAEAHAAGIVHRDLKPANLFLATRSDGSRLVKVLDFGVSKSRAWSSGQLALTDTSMMLGSPLYMSPEQLDSARDVDGRADIWALGVVLYELLTRATPFDGDSIPQLVAAVLNAEPKPLRAHDATIPASLEAAVHHALEKDRQLRCASVGELANALAPHGTAAGRQCAERAVRVLESRGVPSGGPPAGASTEGAALRSATSKAASTPLSWNRSSTDPPPRRRALVAGLSVAAAVALGALAVWLLRGEPAQQPPGPAAAAPPPEAESEPAIPAPEELPSGIEPPQAAPEPATAEEQPAREPQAKAEPETATEASPEPKDAAETKAKAAARRAERARERREARQRRTRGRSPPAETETREPNISDFGGRR